MIFVQIGKDSFLLVFCIKCCVAGDDVVGIATCCGLRGPGVEHHGGKIFYARPYWPRSPPSLLCSRYWFFPAG
jgi:hypothetical protein